MRSVTFTLYMDTDSDYSAPVTITITEQPDGSLLFTISNDSDADGLIADIRGIFFDVNDDSLLGTLSVTGDMITEVDQSGSITNLGGGATVSGLDDAPYEVGIEIGTSGMATDDIQTTSFVLSSSSRALTLDDVALQNFAVRQTSVSTIPFSSDGREASDKLYGDSPYPVNAIDDAEHIYEDTTGTGNLFLNDIDLDAPDDDQDGIGDTLIVTAIDGDTNAVGQTLNLTTGITLVVNSDGSYTLDGTDADWLAEGEVFQTSVTYTVYDGNGGLDTATLFVSVTGTNDQPIAMADVNSTDEANTVNGTVLNNDSDPDLSDVLTVTAVNGVGTIGSEIQLDSGALLTLNADGTYSYDPNGAFDHLNTGESATDFFTYEISDGNGGTDTATVTITVEGIGTPDGPSGPDDSHFGTFTNKKGKEQEISNIVLYLQDDNGHILKVKIDGWSGVTDLDTIDLYGFMEDNGYFDYDLLAVSIKAGNNHNRDLGSGEGQFFLLDGDEDIDYEEGGDVPDGFTLGDLSGKADITYQYDDIWG